MDTVPRDLLWVIFDGLLLREIFAMRAVCRRFREFVRSPEFRWWLADARGYNDQTIWFELYGAPPSLNLDKVPLEFVVRNPQVKWDYEVLSKRVMLPKHLKMAASAPHLWDWRHITRNADVCYIEAYPDLPWHYESCRAISSWHWGIIPTARRHLYASAVRHLGSKLITDPEWWAGKIYAWDIEIDDARKIVDGGYRSWAELSHTINPDIALDNAAPWDWDVIFERLNKTYYIKCTLPFRKLLGCPRDKVLRFTINNYSYHDDIVAHRHELPLTPADWDKLSDGVSFDTVLLDPIAPWNWRKLTSIHSEKIDDNPHLPWVAEVFIEDHPTYEALHPTETTCWVYLSEKCPITFIVEHNYLPWDWKVVWNECFEDEDERILPFVSDEIVLGQASLSAIKARPHLPWKTEQISEYLQDLDDEKYYMLRHRVGLAPRSWLIANLKLL